MKKTASLIFLLSVALFLAAGIPAGYYFTAEGKSGKELKTALHHIVRQGNRLSYGSGSGKTWSGFEQSDLHPDGYVWDMYSLNVRYFPGGARVPGGMNIEHSVAKSWWGGTNNDAYKDLYHLNPSDIAANSARSNYPLGINNGNTFNNGSIKVGNNTYSTEYTGLCFEPKDEYKGDFARAYLYMFTCYENYTWTGNSAPSMLVAKETWPMLRNWAKNILLEWHRNDPVSRKEEDRMAAIFKFQNNRNPYIDYPELAEFIWGTSSTTAWYPGAEVSEPDPDDPEVNPEIQALPATDIRSNGFTANWTASNDSNAYQLNVYTIEKNSSQEPVTILDIDFANGKPVGWNTTGYTDTNTSGSIRLASGSNPGVIMSDELDLTTNNNVLTVRARQYSNDTGATLTVSVDNEVVAEWSTEKDNKNYSVSIPSATGTSVISISAKANRRVYIDELSLIGSTGSYVSVSLPGYPVNVTDSLRYQVTGLEPGVIYYYTISVTGTTSITSNAIPVETRVISSTPLQTVTGPSVSTTPEGIVLYLHEEALIRVIDASGKPVRNESKATGKHTISLPSRGIYLIQLISNHQTASYKLIF